MYRMALCLNFDDSDAFWQRETENMIIATLSME
jgi:hypothetical protein